MGRKRKFEEGSVVFGYKDIAGVDELTSMPFFGVVIDYKLDIRGRGEYGVVRVLHPVNGAPYGELFYMVPHHLVPTVYPNRSTVARRYRANQRLIERECECNCCAHEAIPVSMITKKGTFSWEKD